MLNVYKKMFPKICRGPVKHSVVHSGWFVSYLTKELYHWEKIHAGVNTLLTSNIICRILIPENCIDFDDWENRTGTKKLLCSLLYGSYVNKSYII